MFPFNANALDFIDYLAVRTKKLLNLLQNYYVIEDTPYYQT